MRNSIFLLKSKYIILRFWKEILTTSITIIIFIIAYLMVDEPKKLLFWSIIITTVGLFFNILLLVRNRDFYYLSLTNRNDSEKWIGAGQFKFDRVNNCYSITGSDGGFIFSPTLFWDDYTLELDFKIVNTCIGVILRAINLSDYTMLQIREDGIRPHIKINGGWSITEAQKAGLVFKKDMISKDLWYKCRLSCDKNIIGIKILDLKYKTLFDRQWEIPTGSIKFSFNDDSGNPAKSHIYFPINLEYGSFGFRDSHDEKGLIKNLLVRKI